MSTTAQTMQETALALVTKVIADGWYEADELPSHEQIMRTSEDKAFRLIQILKAETGIGDSVDRTDY